METKISRKTVRKSLAHIYGKIEGIEESGARVLEDFTSGGEGEISLSKVIRSKDYLVRCIKREISADENCVVTVLEDNVNGWWLVR
ncbi:unnamed protein product [Oikopleura dioica]|uniref:SH3 domain-containing protein n=1 Tax=Oikopleura dioica TaxID=34765 RepID=E4Z1I6_OIKDI|nr:unnamed protein product [Oikopleura dioica]